MDIDYQNYRLISLPDVPVPMRSIIRRMGYPREEAQISQRVKLVLDEEIERARKLIIAKGSYRFLKVISRNEQSIAFAHTTFTVQSKQVARLLRQSDPVVIFMVTIGSELENQIDVLMSGGETTRGYVLDAIGSEMADAAVDLLHWDVLNKSAGAFGYTVTPRFSPGYGDWSLTSQKEIVDLCNGASIGISVNEFSVMVPKKSVSGIIGWVAKR